MCGIFGYIGKKKELKKAVPLVIEGIKRLDYRGYDSAGIATISNGKLVCEKKVGSVKELEKILGAKEWFSNVALAHTRWATHGKLTDINAHPHIDAKGECAVVHNGIIENHSDMRKMLEKKGITFCSETDTEVVSQLIGYLYQGDLLKAVQSAVSLLKGSYAIACIHQNHPEEIVCAASECPLSIGLGKEETYISSDSAAFLKYTNRALHLRSSEVALITAKKVEVFDSAARPVSKNSEDIQHYSYEENNIGEHEHYMKKEIFEQPQTVLYALLSRYSEEYGTAIFEDLKISDEELLKIERIVIIGCGTSLHAGLLASYMIEEKARIPVQIEISSEYRYKNPIVAPNTLGIAISQSGETADTIAALRELKEKGAKIVGICNVQGSTIAREVDSCIFLRAGSEIGVASTKAFTGQIAVLALLMLRLGRMRMMSQKEGKEFLHAILQIPTQIKMILEQSDAIHKMAKKYIQEENFFFLGRRYMYPTALEGALKLKEIAYVNANGYPAGEMKHGPLALIDEKTLTVAFTADSLTYSKMLSNLMEIKARGGKILAIAQEGFLDIQAIADDVIFVPKTIDELSPFTSTVVAQLFAYFFAKERGREIDKPRNLAKSVTVE